MDQRFKGNYRVRENGETMVHICAEYGQPDLLEWFVHNYDPDLNPVNDAGETPVMIAAREGNI